MKTNASGTAESVFAPGAKLEKLAGGFDFTEGPTCDAAGNVFFTDQPNDRILKWGVEGELSTLGFQALAPEKVRLADNDGLMPRDESEGVFPEKVPFRERFL
jgi:sugar lactone lactonase YvrE